MLVNKDDLRRYMSGLSLDADQQWDADVILAGLQSQLELYLGRPVEPVQIREFGATDLQGYFNPQFTPVLKIIQVTQVGNAYPSQQFYDDLTLSVMTKDAIVQRPVLDWTGETISTPPVYANGIHVGWASMWYVVEYVAGYRGPFIDAMKMGILQVAARMLANHADDTVSTRVDGTQVASKQDTRQAGWTKDELAAFDRAKRIVMA
jgi:hypothetical protein